VTVAKIDELRKALPQCRIESDGGIIEPTVKTDADRKAAEWVIEQGGSVHANGVERNIKAVAQLPNTQFALTCAHLGGTRVTDDGLNHLEGLKRLKWVNLGGTPVTDAGLKHLKGCSVETFLTGSGQEHEVVGQHAE
jgi:hypothetical protein